MKFVYILIFAMTTLFLLATCSSDLTPVPVTIGCDPAHTYFENDVRPILNSYCARSGCHDKVKHEKGLDYSKYAAAHSTIKPGNASGSELYKVITETDPDDIMPPPGNPSLTQTQIDIIAKWISEGGLNDACTLDSGNCNPQNMSYAADIAPLITNNCLGCHSGGSALGGLDLTTYSSVAASVSTGKFYNSVAQNGLAKPMPESSKLSACNISKIKSWIDAGFPNN